MEAVFQSLSFGMGPLLLKNCSKPLCLGTLLAELDELTDLRLLLPEMLAEKREDSNIPVVGCNPFAAAGIA